MVFSEAQADPSRDIVGIPMSRLDSTMSIATSISHSAPDILHGITDTTSPPPNYETMYPDGPTSAAAVGIVISDPDSPAPPLGNSALYRQHSVPVPSYESVCPDGVVGDDTLPPPSYNDALNCVTVNSNSQVNHKKIGLEF